MFSCYQVTQGSSIPMGNGSHASTCGVGMIDLNFSSGKIVQHVPSMNMNLVSGSLLCRDGFKLLPLDFSHMPRIVK